MVHVLGLMSQSSAVTIQEIRIQRVKVCEMKSSETYSLVWQDDKHAVITGHMCTLSLGVSAVVDPAYFLASDSASGAPEIFMLIVRAAAYNGSILALSRDVHFPASSPASSSSGMVQARMLAEIQQSWQFV